MARPKERMRSLSPYHSPAFEEKCSREKELLHGHVADRLKDDILRLLTEEIHPDLTVVSGTQCCKAHSAILYARAGDHFNLPESSEKHVLTIPGIQYMDNFLKQLYIMENVNLLLEEYKENLLTADKDFKHNYTDKCNSTDVIQPGKTEVKDVSKTGDCTCLTENHVLKVQEESQDSRPHVLHDETSHLSTDSAQNVLGDTRHSYRCDETFEVLINGVEDFSRETRPPLFCDNTSEISSSGIPVVSKDIPAAAVNDESKNISANNNVTSCEDHPDISVESLHSADEQFIKYQSDVEHNIPNGCNCEQDNLKDNHAKSSNVAVIKNGGKTKGTTKNNCLLNQSSEMSCLSLGGCEPSKPNRDCTDSRLADKKDDGSPSKGCSQSEMYEACSTLGQNLLSLYLEQWGSDLDIIVSGHTFKTHKCILAARSQYFSAMFGGSWTESDKQSIKLEGIAATVFEQALLYLYGGVLDISKTCSLSELLLVADMYGIEGLKDVVSFHLRKEYCHFFHKPCSQCTTTLADALMLSISFGLDDVKSRCLRSVGKFFTKFWSTKEFAGLTEEVLKLTCDYIASQLTEKTVIETILECHKLSDSLPRVKWAEPVLHWTTQLLEVAIEYTSEHFVDVVSSEQFLSWRKSAAWSRGVLEEIFRTVIDSLPTDRACGAYRALLRLQEFNTSQENNIYGEDVACLLDSLVSHCEAYIKVYIHQVTQTAEWPLLPEDIKTKILQNSSFVCIDPHVKTRVAMPSGHKGRVSAAVIQALREDNSFRQKRTLLDKTRRAEKPFNKKSSNLHKQTSSGLRQISNQNYSHHLVEKKVLGKHNQNSIQLKSTDICSSCDNDEKVEHSRMRTQDRRRLGSPKTGRSADDMVGDMAGMSRAPGTKSSRSGLRPARSTGSLSMRSFGVIVPSNRSLSTQNLDVDSWGLIRRPVSCHTLERLVPLIETTFCKPCDLGEF